MKGLYNIGEFIHPDDASLVGSLFAFGGKRVVGTQSKRYIPAALRNKRGAGVSQILLDLPI